MANITFLLALKPVQRAGASTKLTPVEKGSGSASKPAKKGDPDGPLSLSRGSQEAVPSRTVTPPAGAEKQPAAEETSFNYLLEQRSAVRGGLRFHGLRQ